MNIPTLGVDLAKNVFQLHGVDSTDKVVVTKRISRVKLTSYIAKLPPCLIGMEARGSANYWARKFQSFGHEVKLMSPQFVKPYVKTNKNDSNDAEAICEAVTRPNMRFVPIKSIAQQDIQAAHRIRSQLIQARTSKCNQIRGLLAEYGIIIPQQIHNVRAKLPEILEDAENELSSLMRRELNRIYCDLVELDKCIKEQDQSIQEIFDSNEDCKRMVMVQKSSLIC